MKLYFSKWLFVSKLRTLKSLATYEEKAKGAGDVERQMFEREVNISNNENKSTNLKEDLVEAKNEINDLC